MQRTSIYITVTAGRAIAPLHRTRSARGPTRAHKATTIASLGTLQTNQTAAKIAFDAGGTFAVYAAAVKAEDIAHHRRILASCLLNGFQPGIAIQALHDLGTGGV